jgi:hypothetical protein
MSFMAAMNEFAAGLPAGDLLQHSSAPSMSRVRFATARAVFEAFPELFKKISTAPTDQFPIDYLERLLSDGNVKDAVTFCAYLLPRREAVWWACGCARALLGDISRSQAAGLLAAEAWVHTPTNELRRAALEIGVDGDNNDPLTWLALAAGWSGGSLISHPQIQTPVPPYMTARATRFAVLLSAHTLKRDQRPAHLQACVAEGIKLAKS